jgi:hypothetical protein
MATWRFHVKIEEVDDPEGRNSSFTFSGDNSDRTEKTEKGVIIEVIEKLTSLLYSKIVADAKEVKEMVDLEDQLQYSKDKLKKKFER